MSQNRGKKSSTGKDSDLSKNPFVALFPSLQHAEEYIKSTNGRQVKGKDEDSYANEQFPDEEIKGEELEYLKHNDSQEWQQKSQIVNDFLQRTFLITVNSDKHKTGWKNHGSSLPNCVLVKGLHKEMKERKEELLLNSDNLNQALMERLSLVHVHIVSYGHHKATVGKESGADEQLFIAYLAYSYKRLHDESALLKRKLKDLCVVEDLEELKSHCESLIFSYTGSILLSPDVFPTKEPHKQFLDLLLKPCDCKYLKEFLDGVVQQYSDESDLSEMFTSVVSYMMETVKSVSLMDPDILQILEILLYFSKNPILAKILVFNRNWSPQSRATVSSTAGLDFERLTLLGPILGTTTVSYNQNQPSEYFLEPSRQSQSDIEVVTNNCRRQIDLICAKAHQIFRNLLENKELQHTILYWIGSCCHQNRKRAQLSIHMGYGSMLTQARDGFFMNMSCVMLKLCQPFLNLSEKPSKLLKINPCYCAVASTLADIQLPDTRIHLVQNLEDSKIAQRTEEMEPVDASGMQFKFVTECFFLTHRCLNMGYLKVASTYQSLMKRLQKVNDVYRDARANALPGPELERIKNTFEADIRTQLSFKAHLLNPSLAESVIRFCAGTAYWLTQQLLAGNDFTDGKHREIDIKNLPDEVQPAMTIIPEYIADNIAECVIFMSHFAGDILEKSEDVLDHIMVFFSLFIGSPKRFNNPHCRAKLAEALAGLLPRRRSDELGVTEMGLGAKIFETNELIPKILPEALLKLFVDIEFTGHSLEFEQKFGYRHHMYAVLEYIWKIPSYNKVFWALFEEGRVYYHEKSEFSAFPRFVNLLMNDSTFLLDEALQHLCKIREMEKERASEEWSKLPPQARQEKDRALFELGEMSRGYNIMANETVHILAYITKDITRPFASPCMVEQTASFLNYFLMHLVGPKRRELKVQDFDKYHFKPGELVKNIASMILNLGTECDFCQAVAADGRSYSSKLYQEAMKVLTQLRVSEDFIEKFGALAVKFEKCSQQTKQDEDNAPEPPEEFVDPILGSLMLEPVLLPSSKKILDKSTIARHLLSDPKDPFNRSALSLDMVVPLPELQETINKWMDDNGIKRPKRYTSKDCSG